MLERAKELISKFCYSEYGSETDFSDLSCVPVAYTTIDDDEKEIQVYINLMKCSVIKEVEGKVVKIEEYDSLSELIDCVLEYMDFEALIAV